jgi:hypothetical protein
VSKKGFAEHRANRRGALCVGFRKLIDFLNRYIRMACSSIVSCARNDPTHPGVNLLLDWRIQVACTGYNYSGRFSQLRMALNRSVASALSLRYAIQQQYISVHHMHCPLVRVE